MRYVPRNTNKHVNDGAKEPRKRSTVGDNNRQGSKVGKMGRGWMEVVKVFSKEIKSCRVSHGHLGTFLFPSTRGKGDA